MHCVFTKMQTIHRDSYCCPIFRGAREGGRDIQNDLPPSKNFSVGGGGGLVRGLAYPPHNYATVSRYCLT